MYFKFQHKKKPLEDDVRTMIFGILATPKLNTVPILFYYHYDMGRFLLNFFSHEKRNWFFSKAFLYNDPWNDDLVLQWWKKTYKQILKCSTKFYNNNNVMSCIFKVKNLLFRELVKIVLISRNFKVFFRVFFYRGIYI